MQALLRDIARLKKGGTAKTVARRISEFKGNRRDSGKVFSELCFCICTANNSAERSLRAQAEIDFCGLDERCLRKRMREVVCRFYNRKTDYILAARGLRKELLRQVRSARSGAELREWLVDNVRGLGYKEASHFLRNIGYDDVAIIDFHIVDLLVRHKLIEKPKTMTKKRYAEIEGVLSGLAAELGLTLAELDLYLWYLETGKVLK